ATTIARIIFAIQWRDIFKLPKSIIWLSLVAGLTNLIYVLAVIDGEVMRVMLLFYLSPLWTLVLAHFWLKERTNQKGLLVIGISLLGAYLMLQDTSGLPLPNNQSEWLALSAGIGFALTNVITRKSVHLSIRAKSFAVWLGVILIALIVMPFFASDFPAPNVFTPGHWLIMALIALLLITATLLVQYGVTQIAATRASVIFLFELVVAAIASYYLAGEVMTAKEWIGGALITVAALFAATNNSSDVASNN
ncbi:MAG: DMT family transporter, partial [Methylophilaceae bacterium]